MSKSVEFVGGLADLEHFSLWGKNKNQSIDTNIHPTEGRNSYESTIQGNNLENGYEARGRNEVGPKNKRKNDEAVSNKRNSVGNEENPACSRDKFEKATNKRKKRSSKTQPHII
jgi:hypothetical protein